MNKQWLAPIPPYLAVWMGLFLLNSAWGALIGFHIAILLVIAFIRPKPFITILFKSKSSTWIFASVLFCSPSGLGLYFLWNSFGIANDLPAQLHSMELNSSSWPYFIAYFALVNPLIEEYFWRGVLGNTTKKLRIGDVIYAGYHALVLYGRVHPLSILFAMAVLTFAGWLWRQMAREDDGLLAPSLGHMAADFTILLTVYRMAGS
ncbi:MAG: CPBP family intramembrane metalloprotease [Chloroflexi bacterium]|nr:CPBP family intramembrane metalloprotease [Chloroflexota bacterium]